MLSTGYLGRVRVPLDFACKSGRGEVPKATVSSPLLSAPRIPNNPGLVVVRGDTTACPANRDRTMWHSSDHLRTQRHNGGLDPFELAIVGRGVLDDLVGAAVSPKAGS